jgi:hypothetical protein
MKTRSGWLIGAVALTVSGVAPASDGHQELLARYAGQAGEAFSAARGRQLYQADVGGRTCTRCHATDIREEGRATFLFFTRKIGPLALSVNPKRFTKPDDADKKFDRYCKEVLGRACTAQEKGDLLAYFTLSAPELARLQAP